MRHHFNSEHLFFMDVETTGFDPIRNDLITCCVIVTNQDLEPVGSFYQKARPDLKSKYYNEGAEAIHGFSRSQQRQFQSRKDFCMNLLWFLNDYRVDYQRETMIFHALRKFDWWFLEWAFRKEDLHFSLWKMFLPEETISTIEMARAAGYTDNKLNTWAERLKFNLNHHDAKSDTECCIEVYGYLREQARFIDGETTNSNNDHNNAEKLFNHFGARIDSR